MSEESGTWFWDALEWFEVGAEIHDMDCFRLEHRLESALVWLEVGYPGAGEPRWIIQFDDVTLFEASYSLGLERDEESLNQSAEGFRVGRVFTYENFGVRVTIEASSAQIARVDGSGDPGPFGPMRMSRILEVSPRDDV